MADRQPAAAIQDDDDIFAAALTVEHDAVTAGRQQGKRDGMKQGYYEGREMGVKKGVELGREIAFYTACAYTWTALAQAQPGAISAKSAHHTHTLTPTPAQTAHHTCAPNPALSIVVPRATTSLQRLSMTLSSSSLASPLHPSFFDSLQTARARYKQLLVHMHVQHCMRRQSGELSEDEQDDGTEGGEDGDSKSGGRSRDIRRIAQAAELSF